MLRLEAARAHPSQQSGEVDRELDVLPSAAHPADQVLVLLRPGVVKRRAATGVDAPELAVAYFVVGLELLAIAAVRKRYLRVSLRLSLVQVTLGGVIVAAVGVAVGHA